MENKGKLYSIALALMTLVFVFLVFISAASAAQVTRIGNGSDPAIYDSKVVWTDDGVVHLYDLTTKTDTEVNSSAASYPAVYGNKLVWHDESSGVPRLAVYNISTAAKTYITQDVDQFSRPAIQGDRIVWSANYNETNYNYNLYMHDISTSTQTRIAYGENPDIYDSKITYAAYDGGDWRDIIVYDITTGEATRVPYTGDLNNPHIYGNTIIWSDTYTRLGYIAMYDIATETVTAVTNDTGTCDDGSESGSDTGIHMNIYGDKIVYAKASNDCLGSAGVYVYNVSTAQSTQVFDYEYNIVTAPDIYDNTVVWGIDNGYIADVANDTGIYMINLSSTGTLPPIAEFAANVTSGIAPLTVLFIDAGNGGTPTSWFWDFGDGINSKHAMNATHTFTSPGTYNVSLTVTNSAGSNSATRPGHVTVTTPLATGFPVADFNSPEAERVLGGINDQGIFENEVISFFDNSTGSPTSWLWDFGDGNTSTQKNPTHAYGKIGGYTVNLTVKNANGSHTISKYGYVLMGIKEEAATPAYFSSDVTSGKAPLTVTFLDDLDAQLPNYPIWREWDFGDGTVQTYVVDDNDSATPYATHTYEKPGKYTVTLSMDNRGGKSIITKYNYVTVTGSDVTDPEAPVANFSSNVTSGYAPLTVQFSDLSRNAVSKVWDFNNDG